MNSWSRLLTSCFWVAWLWLIGLNSTSASAAVAVLANRTPHELGVRRLDEEAPREAPVPPGASLVLKLQQPLAVEVRLAERKVAFTLAPDRAHFVTEEGASLTLHEIAFGPPGILASTTSEPRLRKPPGDLAHGVLGIKLLFDAREPEVQGVWEPRLRKRLEAASVILQHFCQISLRVDSVAVWQPASDTLDTWESLRADFARQVPDARGQVVLGFTRHHPLKPADFARQGGLNEPLGTHMLLPDSGPGFSAQQAFDALMHEWGHYWGATHVLQPDSLMRIDLATPWPGLPGYDAANGLILGMVAEEVSTRGVRRLAELSLPRRQLLAAIYDTIAAAHPEESNSTLRGMLELPAAGSETPHTPAEPASIPENATALSQTRLPAAGGAPVTGEVSVPQVLGGQDLQQGVVHLGNGRLWMTVTAATGAGGAVHLWEYQSAARTWQSRGTSHAASLPQATAGVGSGRLTTRLTPAGDSLFFATAGADAPERSSSGHLWRVATDTGEWEFLTAVPGLLSAVAWSKESCYAIGGPDVTLYQWQVSQRTLAATHLGPNTQAAGELMVDTQGQLWAGIWRPDASQLGSWQLNLVSWDGNRNRVQELPLTEARPSNESELGLLGHFRLPNGDLRLVTAAGAVYDLRTAAGTPAELDWVGNLDPARQSKIVAVGHDPRSQITAALVQPSHRLPHWSWIQMSDSGAVTRLQLSSAELALAGLQIEGPLASDSVGNWYAAGSYQRGPVTVSTQLLRVLRERGLGEEQLSVLAANQSLSRQPVLITIRQPSGSGQRP